MSPPSKKQRTDVEEEGESTSDDEQPVASGSSASGTNDLSNQSETSSIDTDTEIALRQSKSKKTSKRKRRAISPTPFGQTLTALLQTETSTNQPLALAPQIGKRHDHEKLEMRAKRILQKERRQKDEKGRIKDVIGGWGGEKERALRKVAQRGVVKLFNMIQQVQAKEEGPVEATPKPAKHPTRSKASPTKADLRGMEIKKDEKVNLGHDDFMKMISAGGLVATG